MGSATSWADRKVARIITFWQRQWRVKQAPCMACNGSGYYDHDDSPVCSACEGSKREPSRSEDDDAKAREHLAGAFSDPRYRAA